MGSMDREGVDDHVTSVKFTETAYLASLYSLSLPDAWKCNVATWMVEARHGQQLKPRSGFV